MQQLNIPPDLGDLTSFDVNVEGQPEVQYWPIYDYQTYPAAGFSGETLFFQEAIGQTAGKTIEDTNLRTGGRMPTPVNMLITGIEAVFRPGGDVSEQGAAAILQGHWNDLFAVHGGRMSVQLRIGDKPYMEEAPLGVFPTQWRLAGAAALSDSTTAGAAQLAKIDYAVFAGPLYMPAPWRLISNQEFQVAVRSPAAIALPSGVDARWGFRLLGYRYRLAQ